MFCEYRTNTDLYLEIYLWVQGKGKGGSSFHCQRQPQVVLDTFPSELFYAYNLICSSSLFWFCYQSLFWSFLHVKLSF